MKKKLLAGFVAVLMALSGCGQSESKEVSNDGVKKIKVAYDQGYYPYDFINDDGSADGYEIAVLKEVDKLLEDYEFEYVGTTNDDLLIGVNTGKYNVGVKGVWWTEARSETYIFPEHYIGSSIIGIVIRSEDSEKIIDLETFAKESGKLVPIAPQNAQYTIVENYNNVHPNAKIDLIAADQFTISDAYQWVLEGRYDAYINIKTSYESSVEAENGEYHQFADKLKFITYEAIPTWPLFNIDNQELADAYDKAWEKLDKNGTLENLAQKYFGYSLFEYIPQGYKKGDTL